MNIILNLSHYWWPPRQSPAHVGGDDCECGRREAAHGAEADQSAARTGYDQARGAPLHAVRKPDQQVWVQGPNRKGDTVLRGEDRRDRSAPDKGPILRSWDVRHITQPGSVLSAPTRKPDRSVARRRSRRFSD